MKISSLFPAAGSLIIAALLAAPLPGHAQGDEPKTPLSEQMSGIAKDVRSLRKMVSDPKQKDAAVLLVKDMETRASKAEGFEPAKTKSIPAADKDQFLADFHKQMDAFIGDIQKLEAAVNSGNSADATALLDKLQSDKRDGHKKFHAQENHGPGGPGGPGGPWGGGPGGHQPPPDGQAPPPPAQPGANGAGGPPPPPQ